MPADPLSNYLKMFRKKSGLSQRELAELLGASSGSKVSRYERGTRLPSFETVLAYEIVFRVALDELFKGEERALRAKIRKRAQHLSRRLDARPTTPALKHKLDFLTDLIFPLDSDQQ
jgi:transcriptional regulator with XRE-family HTH domain